MPGVPRWPEARSSTVHVHGACVPYTRRREGRGRGRTDGRTIRRARHRPEPPSAPHGPQGHPERPNGQAPQSALRGTRFQRAYGAPGAVFRLGRGESARCRGPSALRRPARPAALALPVTLGDRLIVPSHLRVWPTRADACTRARGETNMGQRTVTGRPCWHDALGRPARRGTDVSLIRRCGDRRRCKLGLPVLASVDKRHTRSRECDRQSVYGL